MKKNVSFHSYFFILAFALTAFQPIQALALTFSVDSSRDAIDTDPGDGFCVTTLNRCTLRAAIMEANAYAGTDTIEVAVSLPIRLTLIGSDDTSTAGDLDITESVSIRSASGFSYTVSARAIGERVLHIVGSPTVLIRNMIAMSGTDDQGGGIYNEGKLSFINGSVKSSVASTHGGGIYSVSGSSLTLKSSHILGNTSELEGGGVYIEPDVTAKINSTEISNNSITARSSPSGGGIYTESDLTVKASTISGNTLTSSYGSGSGGGLYILNANLTLSSTTISENSISVGGSAKGAGIAR